MELVTQTLEKLIGRASTVIGSTSEAVVERKSLNKLPSIMDIPGNTTMYFFKRVIQVCCAKDTGNAPISVTRIMSVFNTVSSEDLKITDIITFNLIVSAEKFL